MDMSDIVVIDEDNGDLEEGEITDDVEPEVEILSYPKTKPKKLPRRYVLHDRSSNSKHRNCKHKTKNKLKKSTKFSSMPFRKHKSSCPRHNVEKYGLSVERLSTAKNESTLCDLKHRENRNNYVSTVKSAFKNYTSPPRAASNLRKVGPNIENEDNFSQLLLNYKKTQERCNQKNDKVDSNCLDNSSKKGNTTQIMNDRKDHVSPSQHHSHEKLLLASTEKKENESEDDDVDELRRIALATFTKKSVVDKESSVKTNGVTSFDLNYVSNPPSEVPAQKPLESYQVECDNGSHDNYDVVDMDIDDDENFENVSNDDLFIIDKTPAVSEFSQNFSNVEHTQNHNINIHDVSQSIPLENGIHHFPPNQFKSNDDFEEELLRAELIASLNSSQRKLPSLLPCKIPMKGKPEIANKTLNSVQKIIIAKQHSVYSKRPVRNLMKRSSKTVVQGKSNFLKLAPKTLKAPPPRSINAAQERLIITLNNDTSTEESEEESDKNTAIQENVPVSSIEALISSARQKSDVSHSKISNSNNVSCLSKAQQEEYNNLKKILAEKEPYSIQPPIVKEKNVPDQTHLTFLGDKISVAKTTLEKEIGKRKQMQAELMKKKQNYMASKLKVQLLKEQLHAAEKLKAANLESWKQCSAKLDVIKKSVSKWATFVRLLETELSNRSSQLEQNPPAPRI
ncbi:uncharacterized protein NPIL_338201 [Nephila pilipes]|uniref:Uncharacterized protein n=1 Tax=Nephila pilipes TaxID=299642 RepID=A0A8X6PXY2_NEPPI|nr:uncharacterized protein NPIL_338201 [Nephila pilipes]